MTTGQRNKIQQWLATKMSIEYVRLVLRKPGRKEKKNTELLLPCNGMCARLPIRGRKKECPGKFQSGILAINPDG